LELAAAVAERVFEPVGPERAQHTVAAGMESDLDSRGRQPPQALCSKPGLRGIRAHELLQLRAELVARSRRQVLDPAPDLVDPGHSSRRAEAEAERGEVEVPVDRVLKALPPESMTTAK